MTHLEQALELAAKGAIFYVSHSGGKDSQAMYSFIRKHVSDSQIRVVHAHLGDMEWNGIIDHIESTIDHQLNVVEAIFNDGSPKDFFGAVMARRAKLDRDGKFDAPAFPSHGNRFCTSDLKRTPIWKFIRNDSGKDNQIVVNCMGLRAEESSARASRIEKKGPIYLHKSETNGVRTSYEWTPIHDWTVEQVWAEIASTGLKPFWAYEKNERLSCVFCIFGSPGDIKHGFEHRPELAEKLAKLERDSRTTMFANGTLAKRIGNIPVTVEE